MPLACIDGLVSIDTKNRPKCSGTWVNQDQVDLSEVANLVQVLDVLFTFDPVLFGIVLFGCATTFVSGWGTGVIVRLLRK